METLTARPLILMVLLTALLATGCDKPAEPPAPTGHIQQAVPQQAEERSDPPAPPIFEDFEGMPQLSLFPRAGDYRPEDGDEKLPYWATFIDHLRRTSGVVAHKQQAQGVKSPFDTPITNLLSLSA